LKYIFKHFTLLWYPDDLNFNFWEVNKDLKWFAHSFLLSALAPLLPSHPLGSLLAAWCPLLRRESNINRVQHQVHLNLIILNIFVFVVADATARQISKLSHRN